MEATKSSETMLSYHRNTRLHSLREFNLNYSEGVFDFETMDKYLTASHE
jgi:hypothetical protein